MSNPIPKLFFPLGRNPKSIKSGFGWRIFNGVRQFHGALDFGAPVGTPVYAAMAGKVIKTEPLNSVGKNDSYGQWRWEKKKIVYMGGHDIEIDHGNGLFTRYSHLSCCAVVIGQMVEEGQLIGETGTAGTGPHLHFELKSAQGYISSNHNIAIDPTNYL